jgi:LuxR family maltose regulon positive regulatory protein
MVDRVLSDLRLAGELAEIRAVDLRFSERETRELLDSSGIVRRARELRLLAAGRRPQITGPR